MLKKFLFSLRFFFAVGMLGRDVVTKSGSRMFEPTVWPHDPILR